MLYILELRRNGSAAVTEVCSATIGFVHELNTRHSHDPKKVSRLLGLNEDNWNADEVITIHSYEHNCPVVDSSFHTMRDLPDQG